MASPFFSPGHVLGHATLTSVIGQISGMQSFSYGGPNMFARTPTEVIENVACNLDAESLKAFRATSREIKDATSYTFAHSCVSSLTVVGASVSLRSSLHFMGTTLFASGALKRLTITGSQVGIRSSHRVEAGSPGATRQGTRELLAIVPNLTSITIREAGIQRSRIGGRKESIQQSFAGVKVKAPCQDNMKHQDTQIFAVPVLQALAASRCSRLTALTVDNATVTSKALMGALRAHSSTLTYVCLRNINMTTGSVAALLQFLKNEMQLSRVVLDGLVSGGKGYEMVPAALARVHVNRTPWRTVQFRHVNDDGTEQQWVAGEWNASMSGSMGVEMGLAAILSHDQWRT